MTTATRGTVRADYCRQAIVTKYHGPTNSRGSRVSATAGPGRLYVAWDHALDVTENHAVAARMYAEKLGWLDHSDFEAGGTGDGFVFVAVPRADA